ncbi:MAG: M1 family metallopeptidase [Anaerolineales bacterium]|nr:M1 family metallopeptidase [Anaerolineales bacterium]
MTHHLRLRTILPALALLAWILGGCFPAPATPPPTPTTYPSVTLDPFSTHTATPFQPVDESVIPPPTSTSLPTDTPIPTPTFTPLLPTPTPTLPPSATPDPGATDLAIPSESARTTYILNASLDYANHSLGVGQVIYYTNQTGVPLGNIVLAVEPNRWSNSFFLSSLLVDNQAWGDYSLNGNRLEVRLGAALNPGERLTLVLQYVLYQPYSSSSHLFGYNSLQAHFTDWYPFIVPYEPAGGWILHPPSNVGEHLVYDPADFDVTLQVSDPAVVIAASGLDYGGGGEHHYHLENARNFVFSASPGYRLSTTVVGSVTVLSYYFAGEHVSGEAILRETTRAVDTYSRRFGPYPHASLTVVEAVFPDGMEYQGLFFLSRDFYRQYGGGVQDNLIVIGIHEAAHQWWYGMVANDQAIEPWLDEALATYSECIFFEDNYPYYRSWWWAFRVDGFGPGGRVDVDIYSGLSFRAYTDAVYLRGARFLQALRDRIGSEAFYAFLLDYTAQMSGRRATAGDFFTILRQHTAADFSDLLTGYFLRQH